MFWRVVPFEALDQASILDLPNLITDQPTALHIAAQLSQRVGRVGTMKITGIVNGKDGYSSRTAWTANTPGLVLAP